MPAQFFFAVLWCLPSALLFVENNMAVKCMSLKNIGGVACFLVVLVTRSACSMFCETLFLSLS